eukprot:NODE_191_length_15469_cov_0.243071.p5 type:complete len:306 gc:universal NODE_191_length_15469_cov_0.243071:7513-6596(-)
MQKNKLLTLVNIGIGIATVLTLILTMIGGADLPGVESWFFLKISRTNTASVTGGMNNLFGNPLGGMGSIPLNNMGPMGIAPVEISFAMRNWCLYSYQYGTLWDINTIPFAEIETRRGREYGNSFVQCTTPKEALRSQMTLMSISQITNSQSIMQMQSDNIFGDAASFFVGIEAMYYWALISTVLATATLTVELFSSQMILPMVSAIFISLAFIPAVIAMSMWAFMITKMKKYAELTINPWGGLSPLGSTTGYARIQIGTCFWLGLVATMLLLLLLITRCFSIYQGRTKATVAQGNGFTRKDVERI